MFPRILKTTVCSSTVFISLNSWDDLKVVINTRVELVRWLLMHLIAVNLCMWIEWITFETSQELHHNGAHEHESAFVRNHSLQLESYDNSNSRSVTSTNITLNGQGHPPELESGECLADTVRELYSVALALNTTVASHTNGKLWHLIVAAYNLSRKASCGRSRSADQPELNSIKFNNLVTYFYS